MKKKLNNHNLIEIRDFLIENKIKPSNEMSYYLSFGFNNDEEFYEFSVVKSVEIIEKITYKTD